MTLHALRAWLVCAAALAAPRLAFACSVCTAARDDKTQDAFMYTTILLSGLPLLMFAGAAFFIWWRLRAQRREAPAEASAAPPGAAPTT